MKGPVRRWLDRLTGQDVRESQRELITVGKRSRIELMSALAKLTDELKGRP